MLIIIVLITIASFIFGIAFLSGYITGWYDRDHEKKFTLFDKEVI